MPGFTLEFTTKNDGLVVIEGDNVKYWKDTGLPTYEGGSEGFDKLFPEIVNEMVERKIVSRI